MLGKRYKLSATVPLLRLSLSWAKIFLVDWQDFEQPYKTYLVREMTAGKSFVDTNQWYASK